MRGCGMNGHPAIPAPAPFLNANHRPHWAARARDTKAWRKAAWANARCKNVTPRAARAHVTVVFHHADRQPATRKPREKDQK